MAGSAAVACAAVLLRDPNQHGSWLICPFLWTTGFYCPGCGTLRAMYSLLHGDVIGAFARNPLLIVSLPLFALTWLGSVRRAWLNVPRRFQIPDPLLWALPVLIAAYWILRNVQGFGFLGPGQ